MAMTLNLTLVVQMAHFLLAYALIARFLLKPAYDAVKSDENRTRQLNALIEQEQKKLQQKREHKRKRWQECQHYFYTNRPHLEATDLGVRSSTMIDQPAAVTRKDLDLQAEHISKKLEEDILR